jgi:glycosyltransferase involved in cell wall biosynthesis
MDSRIRVIHQDNQGVSVARNKGLDIAKGEYIMFIDPDDWIEHDCCQVTYDYISKTNTDVVLFGTYIEPGNKIICYPNINVTLDKEDVQEAILKQDSDKYGVALDVPWGRLIKRDFIEKNKLRFPKGLKISQDGIFNLYLFERTNKAEVISYIGYHYCQNPTSINYKYNPNMIEYILKFVSAAERFITEYNKDIEFKRALGVRCISMIGRVENTFLFHMSSQFSSKEIRQQYKNYINLPLINKYIRYCRIKDCINFNMKVRCFLIKKGRLGIFLYYTLISNTKFRRFKINQ